MAGLVYGYSIGLGYGGGEATVTPTPSPTPTPTPGTPAPVPLIQGRRMAVIGDSRSANGIASQGVNSLIPDYGNGVAMNSNVSGVSTWLAHALGYKMIEVATWSRGGSKTCELCNDYALNLVADQNPDFVIYLGTTNDPVDYSTADARPPELRFGSVPLGDPNADPAFQPRVGSAFPAAPGPDGLGTTIGNLDKMLRFFEARQIPVFCYEIPTQSPSRTQRNADVNNWLRTQYNNGRYPYLLWADVYNTLMSIPGDDDVGTASGIWRTDIESVVGWLSANDDHLHPSPAGGRFLGEWIAASTIMQTATANLTSLVDVPNGSNDSNFLNLNPSLLMGTGTGLGGNIEFGASTGTVSGVVCESWQVRNLMGGNGQVVCSAAPTGGQRLTITRTDGTSSTVGRSVQLRASSYSITPVVGDNYIIQAKIRIPARSAEDIFGAAASLNFVKTGMVDNFGTSISTGAYESIKSTPPRPYMKDGDIVQTVTIPFQITAAMVASAPGTIVVTPWVEIGIIDNINTTTNGPAIFDIEYCGLQKLTTIG
jgi:hypothetical protein